MMTLKEAFRYQTYLDNLVTVGSMKITRFDNSMEVVKVHKCSDANPDATNFTEIVEVPEHFKSDDIIRFLDFCIKNKQELSEAISTAKASIDFDIDAATACNKSRQLVHRKVREMLSMNTSKKLEKGTGYKFNNEGNQTPYFYDIEVVTTEMFSRDDAKAFMKRIISEADELSAKIDAAKVNTEVAYEAPFNVNDTFDDAMTAFLLIPVEEVAQQTE